MPQRENWTIRDARPEDSAAISEVLTEAGVRAWSEFLGEDRMASTKVMGGEGTERYGSETGMVPNFVNLASSKTSM